MFSSSKPKVTNLFAMLFPWQPQKYQYQIHFSIGSHHPVEMFYNKKMHKTGVYRTYTPISKLKFRLTIQKIHSLIDVPVLEGLNKTLKKEPPLESGIKETRTICWQEKVFSRHEIDYYGLKENCKSEYQQLYYNRMKSEPHEPDILFTYVEGDNFYPDDFDNQTHHRVSQVPEMNAESMYLMADLGQEVLLFSIHWNPDDGILLVYPDFNRMSINPYYREVRGFNHQMYHYALEKCSSTEHRIPQPPSTLALTNDSSKPIAFFPLTREEQFIMPKHLQRNLLILFEIVSATAFQYNGIHVRYQIELPRGVENAEENDKLQGSTHSSKDHNGCWHFGYCHELFLMMPEFEEGNQPNIDVFFEAISIDNWQRERYLGQSHLSIQLRPQTTELTLNFVQLTNFDALSDRVEAFLVGNRRKMDLVSFYGKNNTSILNRYGNETRASGRLKVRYQVVRQHQPNVLNDGFYKATRKSKKLTLSELIATYKAARERLEEFIELKY